MSLLQRTSRAMITLLLLAIVACRTTGDVAEVPALIVHADAASRAALQSTLSARFGGAKIRLADDALTHSSLLTLQAGAGSGLVDPAVDGRIVTEPYRFQLLRSGDNCILLDLRDESRHALADTRCVPE